MILLIAAVAPEPQRSRGHRLRLPTAWWIIRRASSRSALFEDLYPRFLYACWRKVA